MRNLNQSECVYLRNLSSLTNWFIIPTTIRSSRQWNFRWQQFLDISFQLFQLWGWKEPAIKLVGNSQKRIGKIRKDRGLSQEHLPTIRVIFKLRILVCFLLGFKIIFFLQSIPRIAGNNTIFLGLLVYVTGLNIRIFGRKYFFKRQFCLVITNARKAVLDLIKRSLCCSPFLSDLFC
jgi:hypothetical protein